MDNYGLGILSLDNVIQTQALMRNFSCRLPAFDTNIIMCSYNEILWTELLFPIKNLIILNSFSYQYRSNFVLGCDTNE